jgi:hypothetical protein
LGFAATNTPALEKKKKERSISSCTFSTLRFCATIIALKMVSKTKKEKKKEVMYS